MTKLVFLFIGIVGTFAALQSGEIAQELLGQSKLIHTHEEFAEKTHIIYSLIGLNYLLELIIKHKIGSQYWSQKTSQHLTTVEYWLNSTINHIIILVLSIIGVVFLSITGALGGAISHGQNTDPVVKFIYNHTVASE